MWLVAFGGSSLILVIVQMYLGHMYQSDMLLSYGASDTHSGFYRLRTLYFQSSQPVPHVVASRLLSGRYSALVFPCV